MRPELPYLAGVAIALVAATKDKGSLPPLTGRMLAAIALILVASATGGTKLAPLVHAIGILFLVATLITAGNVLSRKKKA